ncbi:hypothetical protein cyc_04356 [Cyclospora cayetanensis]|uniref:Uncharacterized protein n=1 Tax=Cyclospora cayetanensis TaxID=88456 RepID=A0A1D3CUE4_9EIME|nr:hypothetical protein cyc_04356 [Cyclospora cayetanensis]
MGPAEGREDSAAVVPDASPPEDACADTNAAGKNPTHGVFRPSAAPSGEASAPSEGGGSLLVAARGRSPSGEGVFTELERAASRVETLKAPKIEQVASSAVLPSVVELLLPPADFEAGSSLAANAPSAAAPRLASPDAASAANTPFRGEAAEPVAALASGKESARTCETAMLDTTAAPPLSTEEGPKGAPGFPAS